LSARPQPKPIPTKQVGGGAKLDQEVGQLDSAITEAGNKIDSSYGYLTALNKRGADNQLPAGDAQGATGGEVGAFVYSVPAPTTRLTKHTPRPSLPASPF
jgi:hypothetical protein